MQHPRVACYKNIVNAFDAASRMDITESTTPLTCGDMDQRPTEKTYNWKV